MSGTLEVFGANLMRFTKTWSPISSVFSIELEGISNACTTKVMMNSPVTSTAARDARNSTVVSFGFSSATTLSSTFSFLATFISFGSSSATVPSSAGVPPAVGRLSRPPATVNHPWKGTASAVQVRIRARLQPCRKATKKNGASAPASVYQPQRPVPARDLKQVRDPIRNVIQPALQRPHPMVIPIPHRPINHQRPPNNIFPRHKSPIAAVLAVVAIVAHHKIMSLGHNQLAILHQFPHLQPPLPFQPKRWNVGPRKIVPEHIVRRLQESHVRFVDRFAVDPDFLLHQPQPVARQPDHPL